MDQVRAAARRDHRWLLYASAEVRLRLESLARALSEGEPRGEEEEQQELGEGAAATAASTAAAREAAAAMFLRQPSLVCKPAALIARRVRAFAALPGIDGDADEYDDEQGARSGSGSDGGGSSAGSSSDDDEGRAAAAAAAAAPPPPAPPGPRSLRALASMPALLNLQPEALRARWALLARLAERCPRWRGELGRMAPSTLAGVLALSERRVAARVGALMPLLERLEAEARVEEEGVVAADVRAPIEEEEAEEGGRAGGGAGRRQRGAKKKRAKAPPPKRPPALRSLAYELKCTDKAFAARRGNGAVAGL